MPLLSICIPTYNFGDFIEETLDSIVPQLSHDIEVVVVDGASTDNTAEVVGNFVRAHANIKYYLLEEKGGIDQDMAKSIELAKGQYCWLLSSDDTIEPDAITRLLASFESDANVILATHNNCSLDLKPLGQHPVLATTEDSCYDFGKPETVKTYFQRAITTEAFFSFMSTLIVKKSYWDTGRLIPEFNGSCWAHAARLFEINQNDPLQVFHLKSPLVNRRGGNDSFALNGLVRRYAIAIEGYDQIADVFFGRSSMEAFHIRRTLRKEYALRKFLYAKWLCTRNPQTEDKAHLNQLIETLYADELLINRLNKHIYRTLPSFVIEILIQIYLMAKKLTVKAS